MAMKYVAPTYERIDKPDSKGNFFVRLAYGVVGSYMDTKSMTTSEVIEEFLNRSGVKTPREFFDKKFKGGKKPQDNPGAEAKNQATFEQKRDKMLDNADRIQYKGHLTKEGVKNALDKGANGTGELTATLFNEDHFKLVGTNSGDCYNPASLEVRLTKEPFSYNDKSVYSEYGTFYHESWHAIDYNYGDFDAPPRADLNFDELMYYKKHPGKYHELYGQRTLSSHYELSTGKTFQQTLIDEYKKAKKDGKITELAKEYKEERRVKFKEEYGFTPDEAVERYNQQREKAEEIRKTQGDDKYIEFTTTKEYIDGRTAYIRATSGYVTPEMYKKYGDISDIISGATQSADGLCGMGHSGSYWKRGGERARAQECFAEFASSKATNPESYELMRKYFPETAKAFDEIYTKLQNGEIKANGTKAKESQKREDNK